MREFYGIKFGLYLLAIQIGFLLIFGFMLNYTDSIRANNVNGSSIKETQYFYFQDVQGMMFVGFGFLMVFLKNYGFSSVGINFLLSAFVIQWSLIIHGVIHEGRYINIDTTSLIKSEFTVAAILISMGACLGKLSPLQHILMALIEVPILLGNEYLGRNIFKAFDAGDSIFIHTFGAYFGMGAAWVISTDIARNHEKDGSSYTSDLFAMIGTVTLWIFWPSFNAGISVGDAQQRAIVNTVISLTGSCVMTFIICSFVTWDSKGNVHGKFNMVYVQNATLAGGVGVGAVAELMIKPWGALLIGCVSGALSTIGYQYLTPLLTKFYLHDTCGVHNLHGMPGVMSGIASAVASSIATNEIYGNKLHILFERIKDESPSIQAGYQLAALATSIGIGFVGGVSTGVILKYIPIFDQPLKNEMYDDEKFWEVPESSESSAQYQIKHTGL